MQKIGDKDFLFSPSDLTSFLGCRHSTYISYKSKMAKDDTSIFVKEIPTSANDELIQTKGYEHEAEYLQTLKDSGLKIVEVEKNDDLQVRADKTIEALKSGADIVFQAVFYDHPWRGDADFLRKIDKPSALGDFSYEVVDTKLARSVAGSHIIQCCAYSEMLEKIQGIPSENIHIVLGDKTEASFKLKDYQYYYEYCKKSFEQYMDYLMGLTDLNDLSLVEECQGGKYCDCDEHYAELHEDERHLKLVANIRKLHIKQLRDNGINNISDLANIDLKTQSFKDINPDMLKKLNHQAMLQEHKHTTGENKVEVIPHDENKGFNRIPRVDAGDLFFDMEGDPLHPGGLEYLFGVYYIDDKGKEQFKDWWAHDPEQEKVAVNDFLEWVAKHLLNYPDAYIYHYNHYETTALKRLTGRYSVQVETLDNLLRLEKFVDLYLVVKEAIRTSEPGYSIKNMEAFYMDKRDQDVATATESIVQYHEWIATQDQKILDDIRDYNEVDCISTKLLRDWLITLRTKENTWFAPDNTGISSLEERKDWEIQHEQYQAKLLKKDKKINSTVADMLEFHRREAKPQWWAKFERQNKEITELIDDNECIAGLEFTGETAQEKKSTLYTYKFPPQEHKLGVGKQIENVETMKTAGTLFSIDSKKGIVQIKKTSQPPESMSISANPIMANNGLIKAMYSFADKVLGTTVKNDCAFDFINREFPKIKGIKQGDDIIKLDDTLGEAKSVISNMNESYMFIQGPPGCGKTYSSSHIIVDLIRQGKKVAISSNSHKAIHNLLASVEKLAVAEKVKITGYKRASKSSQDSMYESEFGEKSNITNSLSNDGTPLNGNLYAGTVFAFSDPHFNNSFDYLFIDEAGQVGTANLVAMSASAKNVVLVGDQMQLGQPIQGVHPNESGTSTLEYLLGEQSTIPANRGIFLGETYRMNSEITKFISDAFYDGRLKSNQVTEKRKLDLNKTELPNSGIAIIHTDHEGCTQKSEEEAEIIKQQYNSLLGQKFIDGDTERTITEDDILIISPYNVQVNYLIEELPDGARVGTVDKFQGQEAPIVIYSMTTSTPDDMPRDVEFLFSKNRLNVAVSRAQCLSIVVMNPKLQEVNCKSPKQMELLNTFCMLGDYANIVRK